MLVAGRWVREMLLREHRTLLADVLCLGFDLRSNAPPFLHTQKRGARLSTVDAARCDCRHSPHLSCWRMLL